VAQAAETKVLAVLSANLGPYQEAYQGLQDVLAGPMTPVYLPANNLKAAGAGRTVIAFGGAAAAQPYPSESPLIYCLAPGTYLNPAHRNSPTIRLFLMPSPQITIAKIQDIQPSIKRLAVLWASDGFSDYHEAFRRSAEAAHLQIEFKHVSEPNALAGVLRQLPGQVDAVWVTSDPTLINSESLLLLKEFSWANKIPLYSPIEGLAERGGAVASVYSSYRDIGRKAGELIQQGLRESQDQYPSEIHLTLNAAAADQVGLLLSDAVRKSASKILQ
jgi:hypothetical protein